MTTTFMHYRKYDRYGQIVPQGGLTLAIKQDGNQVSVAMAECGRKDNFCREFGRRISTGRLNAGKVRVIALPDATSLKSFIHAQDFVQEKVQKLLGGNK